MDESVVIQTLENAWYALCERYNKCPDETIRSATNITASIIAETKRRLLEIKHTEQKKKDSISIAEWCEWLKEA